ncbi:methyltransferase domain-containing protein [Falsiroseomonas sp. HW251]|uniref:methyltransferase domain-containing protein n=1 Tax=Falsiroseomonas sp. HW251 TaxID=3390998 RepID=UPI003D322CB0
MAMLYGPNASSAWRQVDSDPSAATRYLERAGAEIADKKAQVTALLRLAPGQVALECGCGLGRDTEAMARAVVPGGRAIGIDLSAKLVAEAAARTAGLGLPLSFQAGSVMALPFADASFDAVRIERTLQHLPDPMGALAEIRRVLRFGGRIAALEPDWETMALPGDPAEVTRACVAQKALRRIAQARIGRELPWLLHRSGFRGIEPVIGAPLIMRDLDTADFILSLRITLAEAVEAGLTTAQAADAWWADLLARDAAGVFVATLSGMIVAATA